MSNFGIDTKSKKIAIIINPPKDAENFSPDFYPTLNAWLLQNADIYAYITHDLDLLESGEPKRVHVHVYAEMQTCRRLLTNLNELADALGYETNQISIQKASSNPAGFIQYLVHKNNPEKHQYHDSEIITNLTAPELKAILESVAGNCSISFFKSCVSRCNGNLWQLIEMIGLDIYKDYRPVILDLYKALYKGC